MRSGHPIRAVVDLAATARIGVEQVGGKALNLGRLIKAGLPVPDGFCVTTEAYHTVVGDRLDDLLAQLASVTDAAQRRRLAEQARDRISGLPLPDGLAAAIIEHYQILGTDEPVAVRSSATAEDLPFASFAGQQDTYLNMVGTEAVLASVRNCWASLWTERAVSYRAEQDIDPHTVSLAVVVQRMVDADVAGVMFTANPISGTRHETVIDASPGLGEAIVSGAVNPDRFVVDTRSWTILDRRLGDKAVAVRSRPGGGTNVVAAEQSERASLSDQQVLALARLGARVQDHYGSPQDTEWAIDGGTVWLTQARPITTLYPSVGPGDDLRAYLCVSLAQGLTRPISPMGLAAFRLIASSVATAAGFPPREPSAGPSGFAVAGQRIFVEITPVLRHSRARHAALAMAGVMEARTRTVLQALLADPRFAAQPTGSAVPILVRIAARTRAPLRALAAAVRPASAYRGIARLERKLRRRLTVPASASPEARLSYVEELLGHETFLIMPKTLAYAVPGLLLKGLARRALAGLATADEVDVVLRGLPHNVTTEMDLELWRLTERIRVDEPSRVAFTRPGAEVVEDFRQQRLPAVAQTGLSRFLRRYGHRAVAEIDLGMPRWSDDPSHLITVIANYLAAGDVLDPQAQFDRGAAEAERAVAELASRARSAGVLRGVVVSWALSRVRALAGLREKPKFLLVLTLAALRSQLMTIGRALVERGSISSVEDVFFLDLAEVRRGLLGSVLTDVVRDRRQAYALELRRRHIPRLLLSDGTEPEAVAKPAGDGDGLTGSPASAGTVTAPARVVLDPVGAHLEPGEILVAPSTDPGWTPLFLTAGGLVMEMGGSMSHGAVVAREYGIPAVVGVPDATHAIRTGQQITVDGAAGRVLVG